MLILIVVSKNINLIILVQNSIWFVLFPDSRFRGNDNINCITGENTHIFKKDLTRDEGLCIIDNNYQYYIKQFIWVCMNKDGARDILFNYIKEKGLRYTRQRENILEAFLMAGKHITVEELYIILKKKLTLIWI